MDLVVLVGLAFFVIFVVKYLLSSNNSKNGSQKSPQSLESKQNSDDTVSSKKTKSEKVKVLYGSQTGTAKQWGLKLASDVKKEGFEVSVHDLANYDPDNMVEANTIVLFVISTYTDGRPPESCAAFYQWLEDFTNDFRVTKTHYQDLKYGVFGIGNSVYGKQFNTVARHLDKMIHNLSAQRLLPVGLGDNGAGVEIEEAYTIWLQNLLSVLNTTTPTSNTTTTSTTSKPNVIKTSEEPDEDEEDEDNNNNKEPLVDMEDLGKVMKKSLLTKKKKSKKVEEAVKEVEEEEEEDEDEDEEEEEMNNNGEIREMLTPSLSKALSKQGYKLLGSHSGVKLCRWTKAMLRGRGGCYKHTFYGIQSFQCMEMTPSLACANKCVFCWRHHKNPVGKEWKWKVDEPEYLVEQAIKNHQQMIKQMKGVPGVDKDKFEEAFTIRHCALSLVGEPIIYPHINRFVDLLHEKKISSFMVTNAQFPDKIDSLKPVTQLYISVDAGTKESLKKIDRPLFNDFWERFLACIDSLSKKGQRTVFRLTLVKEWNMEEIKNYAQLIERGMPSFVEIKGVTYCGTSTASSLTIKNVPFHEEVLKFSSAIINSSPLLSENYEISCEHEHSCCVLITHKRFKINGKWNTWIDYEKFHKLATSGEHFTDIDYAAETPSWAIVGSEEHGFDPEEIRFRRNKPYQNTGC